MYRGGEPGHFWPKLAGWFLVPAAASIVTRLAAPLVVDEQESPEKQLQTLMTLSGVCHALGAAGSWYVSGNLFEDSAGTQAFFRGGMWSEMVSTLLIPGALVASNQLEKAALPAGPVVKGLNPKSHIDNMVSLLTGGASQKMAAPQLYNQLAR